RQRRDVFLREGRLEHERREHRAASRQRDGDDDGYLRGHGNGGGADVEDSVALLRHRRDGDSRSISAFYRRKRRPLQLQLVEIRRTRGWRSAGWRRRRGRRARRRRREQLQLEWLDVEREQLRQQQQQR